MVNVNWVDLEHRVWKKLRQVPNLDSVLVALSGGVDSVSLLLVLNNLKSALNIKLQACYVHHGPGSNLAYRNQAQIFCQNLCEKYQIDFNVAGPSVAELKSEEDLREFRYCKLLEVKQKTNSHWIALGQHQDDLLETRLMRLIRGAGLQGLESMSLVESDRLRPFLDIKKTQLISYLGGKSEAFIEDPSNAEIGSFRNWLRRTWLPELESYQEGSVARLAGSLELIVESLHVERHDWANGKINRAEFCTWTVAEKKRQIAGLLWSSGWRDYSSGQIEEILKNLDKNQTEYTFSIGPRIWRIDAAQICLLAK